MKPWMVNTLRVGAAVGCTAFQATILPSMAVGGVKPDFPLLVAVMVGLTQGSMAGMKWGGLLGVCVDGVSLAPFGIHTLLTALWGGAAGLVRSHVNKQYILVPAILFMAMSVMHMLLFGFIQALVYPGYTWHSAMLWNGLKGTVYGAVLASVAFRGYQWWDEWRMSQRTRRRTWSV